MYRVRSYPPVHSRRTDTCYNSGTAGAIPAGIILGPDPLLVDCFIPLPKSKKSPYPYAYYTTPHSTPSGLLRGRRKRRNDPFGQHSSSSSHLFCIIAADLYQDLSVIISLIYYRIGHFRIVTCEKFRNLHKQVGEWKIHGLMMTLL